MKWFFKINFFGLNKRQKMALYAFEKDLKFGSNFVFSLKSFFVFLIQLNLLNLKQNCLFKLFSFLLMMLWMEWVLVVLWTNWGQQCCCLNWTCQLSTIDKSSSSCISSSTFSVKNKTDTSVKFNPCENVCVEAKWKWTQICTGGLCRFCFFFKVFLFR